ncbi:MAG: peptidase [Desulfobacteraceae bacterium IS3]|nr:MAG: peptidase [Desulfobacteraceae bacterium IS3]
MIKSFSHKGLENFFYDGVKKGIQTKHTNRIALILDYLDAAGRIEDMNFPGLDLHLLKGKKKGFWAVKISGNWRIIFRFETGDAYDVDYTDYH